MIAWKCFSVSASIAALGWGACASNEVDPIVRARSKFLMEGKGNTGVQDGGSKRGFRTEVHDGGSRRRFTTAVHDVGSRRRFTGGHDALIVSVGPD
jgi:hypothetical protein